MEHFQPSLVSKFTRFATIYKIVLPKVTKCQPSFMHSLKCCYSRIPFVSLQPADQNIQMKLDGTTERHSRSIFLTSKLYFQATESRHQPYSDVESTKSIHFTQSRYDLMISFKLHTVSYAILRNYIIPNTINTIPLIPIIHNTIDFPFFHIVNGANSC